MENQLSHLGLAKLGQKIVEHASLDWIEESELPAIAA